MSVRNLSPRFVAVAGLVLAVCGVAALATSIIGYRHGWWQVSSALNISEWAAYAAVSGFVVSMLGAVFSWSRVRQRCFVISLFGLAVSLPVVGMAAQWEYATRTYPPINDISTDIEDPPVFWDMPNPTVYPGAETAVFQRLAYPDLTPLNLKVAPDRVYALALALVKDKGWEIAAVQPVEGRIEAVERSFFYGFKDEIVVRITPSDGGVRVDLRSRSRIGRIDRGVNAKRIRTFLAALKNNAGKVDR